MKSKSEIYSGLSDYIVKRLNDMALKKGLSPIVSRISGMTSTLSTAERLPCLLLAIDSREIKDVYFTDFKISLGISFTSTSPNDSEKTGDEWEDILEELFRDDCTLGGNVLEIGHDISIEGIALSGMYVVYCEFSAEVER